jgi:hypothetical protein
VLAEAEPAALPGYRALALRTAQRAEAAGLLSSSVAAEVAAVIEEEASS